LLFRRLTSNETQKNLCPGTHTWPGSPSPSSPGPDAISIDKWQSVYEWILSLDTSSASEERSNQLHDLARAYSLPATLSLRYNHLQHFSQTDCLLDNFCSTPYGHIKTFLIDF
jgi:hypothetical protein